MPYLYALAAILIWQAHGYAQTQTGPQPPCGESSVQYPAVDSAPAVKFWNASDFAHDWKPPVCTGWAATGFGTLVSTAARFRYTAGAESLLQRIGAVSKLAGTRYWSTTHKQWQTLIVEAYALTGPPPARRREDFTPGEMKEGKILYFEQVDNLSGKAVYRMRVHKATDERMVFDVENVTTMRYFFVNLFDPGEMQSIYFLDRESENVWRYFSIARTGKNASRLTTGHESSSVNRAVAFYRALAGIPTDQEPPAAR